MSTSKVALVCSARSNNTKVQGTTNRLLRAAHYAATPGSPDFRPVLEEVRQDHKEACDSYIKDSIIRNRLVTEISDECDLVIRLLEASETIEEVSSKVLDKVMSTGEKLSCRFMAALLRDHGVDAEYVDFSEIVETPSKGGLSHEFYQEVAQSMARRLKECKAQVPVITGYFGTINGGVLDKIGRGYTDLCAALVAIATNAKELQIWKEVDGIFTADPRKVPTARLLSQISPSEAAELTFYGSEVIHPFTMEQVIRARIPIRIKNVMNPRGSGTIVYPDSESELDLTSPTHNPKLFRTRSSSLLFERKRAKRPTAVTVKNKILVINVHSNRRSLSHGFFAKIFQTLDKWRLSIDLIATSEVHVSMALHSVSPLFTGKSEDDYQIVDLSLKSAIDELRAFGTVDIIPNMAIISLVGKQMKNMIGVAGKMFSTLGENNVNIEMISQGKISTIGEGLC